MHRVFAFFWFGISWWTGKLNTHKPSVLLSLICKGIWQNPFAIVGDKQEHSSYNRIVAKLCTKSLSSEQASITSKSFMSLQIFCTKWYIWCLRIYALISIQIQHRVVIIIVNR